MLSSLFIVLTILKRNHKWFEMQSVTRGFKEVGYRGSRLSIWIYWKRELFTFWGARDSFVQNELIDRWNHQKVKDWNTVESPSCCWLCAIFFFFFCSRVAHMKRLNLPEHVQALSWILNVCHQSLKTFDIKYLCTNHISSCYSSEPCVMCNHIVEL